MTTQASEILTYNGQEFLFDPHPLETYFKLGGAHVPFMVNTTMCWRGYVGSWAIENDELRLTGIHGHIAEEPAKEIASRAFRHNVDYDDPTLCRIATIDSIFPGCDGPIFAHWYSGPIEALDSETLSTELLADVQRGRIVSLRTAPAGEKA
jgi:hypothetical protein